jgi:hypothetical protein
MPFEQQPPVHCHSKEPHETPYSAVSGVPAACPFVLKFKYEIHCKMVAEDNNGVRTNLEQILESMPATILQWISYLNLSTNAF